MSVFFSMTAYSLIALDIAALLSDPPLLIYLGFITQITIPFSQKFYYFLDTRLTRINSG